MRITPLPNMVWIPGGTVCMGTDSPYAQEMPAREVTVGGFWIDKYPVTNERFSRFVAETRHVTFAEIPPDPADYPGVLPYMLYAGSLVFHRPTGPAGRGDIGNWWSYVRGADWRHPRGAHSSTCGLERHPVVHITLADAQAFAGWEGKELPTEAEWEFAALGEVEELARQKQAEGGSEDTWPVDALPRNDYGVHGMIGNIWEWTSDWDVARHHAYVRQAVTSTSHLGFRCLVRSHR
jgi:formylglycine-generating enzyme required for sulfatase activity